MKLKAPPISIDMQVRRDEWRLRELRCTGGLHVQAVMLYAVARATSIPIEAMPKPKLEHLWAAFKSAINCKLVQWPDMPLSLLSSGERFAVAVGILFDAPSLPTGESFLEIIDSATESGVNAAGVFALRAVIGLPTVQAVVPADVLRFHLESFDDFRAVQDMPCRI